MSVNVQPPYTPQPSQQHYIYDRDCITAHVSWQMRDTYAVRQDFHPLDWASHLRQSLVFDPVPTVLALLIVASHYHACCSNNSDAGSNPNSATPSFGASIQNETSVLGFLFGSLSSAARIVRSMNASEWCMGAAAWHHHQTEHELSGSACIVDTPIKAMLRSRAKLKPREDDSPNNVIRKPETPITVLQSNGKEHQQGGEEQPSSVSFTDGVLRVSMADPFTIAYNTWSYISNGGAEESEEPYQIQKDEEPPRQTKKAALPASNDSKDCKNTHTHESAKAEQRNVDEHDGADHVWVPVLALHAIGLGGVAFALAPSLFVQEHLLACNAGIVATKNRQWHTPSACWPLLNSSVLVFCLSLLSCCAIHYVLEMRALALCTAMHLVARIMAAYMDVCMGCPLPPVYMPSTAATGMALCMGLLLMCISQFGNCGGGGWDTGTFYMNHAWACGVSVLVLRHTVFRGAVWMVGCAQAELLREMVMGVGGETACVVANNGGGRTCLRGRGYANNAE